MTHQSRHRRKHRARLIADPSEQTSEYPGFFTLPRAERRAERVKTAVMGLLLLGGFIAVMAYFFFRFGIAWTAAPDKPASFISDPKSLR